MKIIFMGTPDFACPALKAIVRSGHKLLGVVTGEDKRQGRGRKLRETPVKKLAKENNLQVFQPASLKSESFLKQMQDISPDIFVVVAFRILPRELINIPKFGAINLHASLLPKYRGAAPINWAIINGEKETGNTIFQIKPKVDTGDILFQQKIEIGEDDIAGTIHDKLSEIGAPALVKVLDDLENQNIKPLIQNNEKATKAPKIFPELGKINWNNDAISIKNLVHGLSPWPAAVSKFNNKRIKFFQAEILDTDTQNSAGTIVILDKVKIGIQTGKGIFLPLLIQSEGKKTMKIVDFLKGFQGKIGDRFAI